MNRFGGDHSTIELVSLFISMEDGKDVFDPSLQNVDYFDTAPAAEIISINSLVIAA